MKTIKRLTQYILKYKLAFILSLLVAIPAGSIEAVVAYCLKPVLDNVLTSKNLSLLTLLPVGIIILFSISGIARYFQIYSTRYVVQGLLKDLRDELYNKFQKLSIRYHENTHSGELISRITNDSAVLEITLTDSINIFVTRTISLVALVFVVIYQNWLLAIICLTVISTVIYPITRINKKIKTSSHVMQSDLARITSILAENLKGIKTIKSYVLENVQLQRFQSENRRYFNSYMKMVRQVAILSPLLYIVGALAIASIVWCGGYLVIHESLTIGSLISFIVAFLLMYTPIKTLGRVISDYQRAIASSERMFQILDVEEEDYSNKNRVKFPSSLQEITFQNVTFAYNSTATVLDNVSFTAKHGELIALVGQSGAGKTTIANLLLRFYDPIAGTILINGQNIHTFSLHDLRAHIAYVSQEVFLFNYSIAENIGMNQEAIEEERLKMAAETAYIDNYVTTLPDAYQSVVGELGNKLSGGQRQRIAIARAIYKDAPILILDEATSALDNESEAMVKAALDNLIKDKTAFVIAHRLSTIINADKIIVLHRGKIVDIGKHEDLIHTSETYKNLYLKDFYETAQK